MIKMIQNLENKMELQINSLETKIEKMQEMFNKDLEEIKKSQLKMNNAETPRDRGAWWARVHGVEKRVGHDWTWTQNHFLKIEI